MSASTNEPGLAAAVVRHEIENLIARYCMACDDRDIVTLMSLFTEDAYFGADKGGDATGHKAVYEQYRLRLGAMGPTYHWTHDRLIEPDPSDVNKATGVILGHCEVSIAGVGYVGALRYYDQYRRVNGEWKFARRGIKFLYFTQADQMASALTKPDRVWRYDKVEQADIPEQMPTWNNWLSIPYPGLNS